MNTKCFQHSNNNFICYCFKDRINLCNLCLNEGSHLEHFKINFEEISPIKIDGNNEEIEIFENIINYFKQKIKDKNEEKKKKIDKDFDEKENEINSNFEEEKRKIESNKNLEQIEINKKINTKEEQIKKEYYNNLKETANNIIKELSSFINILNDNIINNSNYSSDMNKKFENFQKLFVNIEKINNKSKEEILILI